jgi:hypothetical protein
VISELEQRLADVISSRLPAPFGGRVFPASDVPAPDGTPRIVVAVRRAERVEPDVGSARPERTDGTGVKRVVRLVCTVELEVRAASSGGRAQELAGVDAALYVLDAPEFRTGAALAASGDLGFLATSTRLLETSVPDGGARVTLTVDGWFWPAGAEGVTGAPIAEVRVRGAVLPIVVEPASRLVAGGAPVSLAIRFLPAGRLRLVEGTPPPPLPFGWLALRVVDAGGRPGAGTLSGGVAGTDGVELAEIHDGVAEIVYTPPGETAIDHLVISLDDGEGNAGVELGRYTLRVKGA